MDNKHSRKILRSPVAKRRSRITPKDQKVTLERVLGFTATNNATLACDPNSSIVAYPAGCVVVIYNPKKNKQSHIFNVSKKTLISLAFSGDGKHLITGESGHQPAVRVWDVVEKTQVAEFHGHKFGISCVAFSPNLKYIVSIGTQHDMQVNVWNWKTGSKVASNKVSSKVTAVSFSADGSYFVTVGMRHVKFWYLDSSKSKINETVPLNGRNGILADHKNNFFCDVATGSGLQEKQTFCITQSGFLCQFNEKRQMDKWVDLRTTCANCISCADDYIFVGCANGAVRVFDASSLHFVVTLPRPHYLGVDIAAAINPSQISLNRDGDIKYPDVIALRFDQEHKKVTCIYNDHSMYVWDVHDLKKIGKAWSFLYHSSCVYGVEVYPVLEPGQQPVLPPNSFFTCSSDDTIRIWNLDPHMAETPSYKNNIYSHELLKVMYMDPSLSSLCDVDYNPSGATDKTDTNYDDKNGIRSIRVSPDGQHLASGDRQGNVRIHELNRLVEVKQIEAHESEVLCLEYSHWKNGPKLLASSSRDRLIHVFDTEQQYGLLQTLSDHSSSISAIKFTETDGQLKMITCGADKSILFRNLHQEQGFQFTLATHQVEKMTLYDMDVEPTQKFTAIAGQDRVVRIYNIKNGKKKTEYKGSLGDDGILLKMKLDPSGSYCATSCSDKNLCILDFYTGELVATMFGHSEIATDVRFMNDLKHLISTSGDGCIFVWRLPQEMTSHMQSRMKDTGQILPNLNNSSIKLNPAVSALKQDQVDSGGEISDREFFSPERALKMMYPTEYDKTEVAENTSPTGSVSMDLRFSISQLPNWAKKQFDGGDTCKEVPTAHENQGPRGRWAQRSEGQGITVKQQDGKLVEIDFATDRCRLSYEVETSSQAADIRRETVVLSRTSSAPKNMPVIYDESAIDEEDDDFLPLSSTSFARQDSTLEKHDASWEDQFGLENDDGDQMDRSQIIYYLPSETDGSDTLANPYEVFNNDRSQKPLRHSQSMSSNHDADSESTDHVSLEDMEDETDSFPTTPMDDIAKYQNREKFLKETFENLSFTPGLPTEKFVEGLDTLEAERLAHTVTATPVNSRQSLSARFLSRSHAANMRNAGALGNIQRQDNWFDSVQRRKDDMARNLDESRKMLMAMGWKQNSHETDDEFDKHVSDTSNLIPDPENTDKDFKSHCDGEVKVPANQSQKDQLEQQSTSFPAKTEKDKKVTQTSKGSLTRPRTLQFGDKIGDKLNNKAQASASYSNRKGTAAFSPPSVKTNENKKKNSRLSDPNLCRLETDSKSRVSSNNLSKSKSISMQCLRSADREEPKPIGTIQKPHINWSSSTLASFGSVPDLLAADTDEEIFSPGSSVDSRSSDRTKSDQEVEFVNKDLKCSKVVDRKSALTRQNGDSEHVDSGLIKRSVSASRLSNAQTVSSAGSEKAKKGLNKKVSANVSNLKSNVDGKIKDRILMPPPAVINVAKLKQETRVVKHADPKRRTTGSTDLTLEEAKSILQGNSGILTHNGTSKSKRSSISPLRDTSEKVSVSEEKVNNDELSIITDPGILGIETEIEMTAAELRRQSCPSSKCVPLDACPNDLPIRDIPPERDIPSECGTPRTKTKHANVIINPVTKQPKSSSKVIDSCQDSQIDSLRDSGFSTQEDEECSSPSIKERIARLNKHVNEVERPLSQSPSRVSYRSESPVQRLTSSAQITFSNAPKSVANNAVVTTVVSMVSTNITMAISSSALSSIAQPLSQGVGVSNESHLLTGNDIPQEGSSQLSLHSMKTSSSQELSSPSVLTSSSDSELLSNNLSPVSHSDPSPRNVTDMETEWNIADNINNSHSYQGDQLQKQSVVTEDTPTALLDTLDQMHSHTDKAVALYRQLENKDDERSVDVKRQFHDRFLAMSKLVCEILGITHIAHDNQDVIVVSRDALSDLAQRLDTIMTSKCDSKCLYKT